LAAALVALVGPGSSAAANTRIFHDPLGDVTCCTRDLTDIRVSNTDAGTVRFDAHFDDRVEGNDDDDLYLSLDTDRNPATGQFGADYQITAHINPGRADSVTLGKWNTNDFLEQPAKGLAVSVVDHQILISLDRHLIGDTDGFNFSFALWEVTSMGGANAEFAPDKGTWFFPVKLDLRRLRPTLETTPRLPRAGGPFVARLALRVAGTHSLLASGRVLCTASIGDATLRPGIATFSERRAVCTWKVPKSAHGRTLRGSIAVAVTARARVYRYFSARVA
jgi:hypothetical protein